MLFSGEEGLKPTEALSGGETARLLFCRIMLQKPNVLVLDEPTNHLDLESINALNIALQKYEGTVFLVTHDQDLMEEVGTRVWHFEPGQHRRLQGHVRRVAQPTLASQRYVRHAERESLSRLGSRSDFAPDGLVRLAFVDCYNTSMTSNEIRASFLKYLRAERPPRRPELAARAGRRSDAALHQRRDEPVQGRLPRPREARLHARDDARRSACASAASTTTSTTSGRRCAITRSSRCSATSRSATTSRRTRSRSPGRC